MTYVTFPGMPVSFRLSFLKSNASQTHKNYQDSNRGGLKVRCKMNQPGEIDRRNVLIGLGGLYTTSNLTQPALSDPVLPPDLTKCGKAIITGEETVECCPPTNEIITDFKLPRPTRLRVRPAAETVNEKYIEKFEKAVKIMKELPSSDPRSFYQQANVHCAYCNGSYDQVNFPDLKIQVHNSWLFFPWHRCYLYFFEKILGKLIDDPSFAMPFWNWDNPVGMKIPAIYANSNSSLYDPYRDPLHQPPTLINFNLEETDEATTYSDNLTLMYKQMYSNGKTDNAFLGEPYRAGDDLDPGAGSMENSPHIPVHRWTGDPDQPHHENMGNFYSAGRDPIFYAHHSNIDRLWSVWLTLGGRRKNFTDPDWLDASFLFYDENARLVKIKIRDCLHEKKLGYTYEPVVNPWKDVPRPTPRTRTTTVQSKDTTSTSTSTATTLPIVLDQKPVTIRVSRPNKKKRSTKEKEEEEEVLLIQGIEFDGDSFVKFDVLVNDEDEGVTLTGPNKAEFAGTFANLPHLHKEGKEMTIKTCLRLGITDLLEELDVEDDDSILVTLVPKSVPTTVTISSVKIVLE